MSLLFSCKDRRTGYDIESFGKEKEEVEVKLGAVQHEISPKKLSTHKVREGDNYIIVYKRTGTTFIDANDYEARYTETLVCQIDSFSKENKYCDSSLVEVEAKYYWVALSKEPKKEVREVRQGCIEGLVIGDSLLLKINIEVDFRFGGFLEKKDSRKINYQGTVPLPHSSNKVSL